MLARLRRWGVRFLSDGEQEALRQLWGAFRKDRSRTYAALFDAHLQRTGAGLRKAWKMNPVHVLQLAFFVSTRSADLATHLTVRRKKPCATT